MTKNSFYALSLGLIHFLAFLQQEDTKISEIGNIDYNKWMFFAIPWLTGEVVIDQTRFVGETFGSIMGVRQEGGHKS